jgi:hypothetical protein
LPAGNGDLFLDDISDGEWEFREDPPELLGALRRLAVGSTTCVSTAAEGVLMDPEVHLFD